jgi:protoporphyrinogen oxidase
LRRHGFAEQDILDRATVSGDVFIIGAGPAGLTAAHELQAAGRGAIHIVDSDTQVGGISKTIVHNGNRIDIGGHRFFSKSDWVMRWWLDKLPIADASEPASLAPASGHAFLAYQGMSSQLPLETLPRADGAASMLVRDRLSRILFGGKLFAYPLKIDVATAWKLGPLACAWYALSYARAHAFPIKPEVTLEDFFINRFGRRLYRRFFKTYTEKVWGRACSDISAAWGAQRVKGLSISRAIAHALRQLISPKSKVRETSLIEHFLYPRLGPGQMWETVAERVTAAGATLTMSTRVTGLKLADRRIAAVETEDVASGERAWHDAGQVISTMPIRELVGAMQGAVPARVSEIAAALEYRDFMTVGLRYRKLARVENRRADGRASVPDNWIYIQEPDVKVGRLQIFNNWSPYLVAPDPQAPDQVWVGLEFFCAEGDALWSSSDADMIALAKREMAQIGMADPDECVDAVVIRMPKAYPGYYGAYEHFDEVRAFLDGIENLWCVGRNGMHRYNNQDHSMLSAKRAVEAIVEGRTDKAAIWAVNIDDAYHEEGDDRPADAQGTRVIPDDEPESLAKAVPAEVGARPVTA